MRWEKDWETRLDITPQSVRLMVTDQGQMVLQARFCGRPVHPRALPLILEGLALWEGKRLCVVTFAERAVHPTLGLGEDGDTWPPENRLVEYMLVEPPLHGRPSSGRCSP
ncbi:hypothetical protein ACFL6M_02400 [Candidatus Eisenbacteria bacterium]|uniref:Uncharacterized protein n=1 Tax=Eiseniibacteriota bacterium TaxID=2212470 RepID=A0ABV6YJB3_UNCEI